MFELYRWCCVRVLKPLLEKRFFSDVSAREAIFATKPAGKKGGRFWFHAASVGELEMLIPVIQSWLEAQKDAELILSIFSESAKSALAAFSEQTRQRIQARLIYAGYSPWEGEWLKALTLYQPDRFVTARYEAWPELWAALGAREIPLSVVGARSRGSLRTARRLVRLFGGRLPFFQFFTVDRSEVEGLRADFPDAEVEEMGDPRWERVFARTSQSHPRARALTQGLAGLPKPWGVIGSAWIEDLEFLGKDLFAHPGTVWVVPHQVGTDSIERFERLFDAWKIPFLKTSRFGGWLEGGGLPCILVDEMGFLSELYASAEWAFVGGGFGQSIHNLIEPAIHGIPVACGPAGITRFPEVELLREWGQLSILRQSEDCARWMNQRAVPEAQRKAWREKALLQRGAAARIVARF
ncbi:MAG: glycosyltransferase N-terminal domain-containing protein [Oligoflexia bacterium]|nr:glycosyltransferase N-terminal domain-containing protein [Oligoflexia bacterium]